MRFKPLVSTFACTMIASKFLPHHCFVPRITRRSLWVAAPRRVQHSMHRQHCSGQQVLYQTSFSRLQKLSLLPRQCSAVCLDKHEKDCDPLLSSIDACWNATAWTVNSGGNERVNEILQRLCSPAPQSFFALDRAVQRYLDDQGKHPPSSEGLEQVLSKFLYLLKKGYQFVIEKTLSLDPCWSVISLDSTPKGGWQVVKCTHMPDNTLEIAHKALDKVTEASTNRLDLDDTNLQAFGSQANERLNQTLGTDIRGRSSADAAFNFALAGVQDPSLYRILTAVCRMELLRIGSRPSFKSKYILQMVEKLAAAGVKQGQYGVENDVYRIAAELLSEKGHKEHAQIVESLKTKNGFDLLSPRPLFWLWRFSARQTKPTSATGATLETHSEGKENDLPQGLLHSETNSQLRPNHSWLSNLEDKTRPLVVDVGCGMGVSLLGLSTMKHQNQQESSTSNGLFKVDWTECNFVGVDLSQLSISFARGISRRWQLEKKVQFVCKPAQDLLKEISEIYPGHVALVMIQFPTPFRLQVKEVDGNTQLPSDPSSGFLVTQALLQSAAKLVESSPCGRILVQSNCEDVAVTMKDMALETAGLECVSVPNPVTRTIDKLDYGRIPLRTEEWIRQGGKRAVGQEWSRNALLPSRGATETEVACHMQETPIHSCLLKPRE